MFHLAHFFSCFEDFLATPTASSSVVFLRYIDTLGSWLKYTATGTITRNEMELRMVCREGANYEVLLGFPNTWDKFSMVLTLCHSGRGIVGSRQLKLLYMFFL
jgi:hypothetical protein